MLVSGRRRCIHILTNFTHHNNKSTRHQLHTRVVAYLPEDEGMTAVQQLKEHFSQIKPSEQAAGWEATWQKKITPWDRGLPNPALVDAMQEKHDILGRSSPPKRKRALVPGCGRGYDVLLLASYGYDAWGLDTAPSAVKAAQELKESDDNPVQYPVQDETAGAGQATFLLANFFEDSYLEQSQGSKFDVIYDYTFLCALHPDMRSQWAKRMSNLLADNGTLICLEFPLSKPPTSGGPPHGLSSELYVELFKRPGEEVSYDESGFVKPDHAKQISSSGLSRIAHWKPARTHAVGQASDMISMWQHSR